MKKKNIELGKLKLAKRNIASLENTQQVTGGSIVFTCIETIIGCPQPSKIDCPQPTGPSGCLCPSEPPICFPTQIDCVTQQNCITQHSCGGFLCDDQIPGGF